MGTQSALEFLQHTYQVILVATVLLARQLLTPLERVEDAALVIEDGVIAAVGARANLSVPPNARITDYGDAILTPGLIDIHIHGGAGHDVMETSGEGLAAIERLMARHGVTSYCPTTVTAPADETLASLENLATAVQEATKRSHSDRAQPLGIHIEGPFLSHARRGVHPSTLLRPVSAHLFEQMWEASAGHIRVLTIAPELERALDVIASAAARGICVSIGHTNADLAQAAAGVQAGARHATHTFNAMRRMTHRDPGVLGELLTNDAVTADIIADGMHVEPNVVDLFLRVKGVDRAVLITDAISATGMPDGTYRLGSFEVQVRDGRCESYGKLAGSVLTMDVALRNIMNFARLSFQDSIRLATVNPARALGLEGRKGVLKSGADADVTVFSPSGEVRKIIVRGQLQ
jgi:N-acetylglucosamine-6-phosphate deacetylase